MADTIQSDNPNFNPDEWEECRENAFFWWWRILATISTIVLAVLFYYYVEQTKKNDAKYKKTDRHEHQADDTVQHKTVYAKYEQQVSNGSANESSDGGLRQRVVIKKEENSNEGPVHKITSTSQETYQFNKPEIEKSSSEIWAINKVLTTVEVTLTKQQNGDQTQHKSEWSDDKTIVSGRYVGTDATSTSLDTSSTDRGDSWSVDNSASKILTRHDRLSGLEDHDSGPKSPGKPVFVTELKVTDNNATDNGTGEEATNSILEIANVQTTEELLLKVETLEAITEIMRQAGLESSNLIFGIDYTASNKYQGEESFGGKSLHTIAKGTLNPYQQVISILGKTMAPFASSGFIAAYGFGDVKTSDSDVFSIKSDGVCHSFAEVLSKYNDITPQVILSGPTNFAPLIYEAMNICKTVRDYHILVIVADGQVTNEKATRRAIVDACKYPLSIIVVGVGDGPWEMMKVFDESLPKRKWDNFHFVEFHKITAKAENPDLAFAIQALLEIPDQFKKIKSLGLLDFSEE